MFVSQTDTKKFASLQNLCKTNFHKEEKDERWWEEEEEDDDKEITFFHSLSFLAKNTFSKATFLLFHDVNSSGNELKFGEEKRNSKFMANNLQEFIIITFHSHLTWIYFNFSSSLFSHKK